MRERDEEKQRKRFFFHLIIISNSIVVLGFKCEKYNKSIGIKRKSRSPSSIRIYRYIFLYRVTVVCIFVFFFYRFFTYSVPIDTICYSRDFFFSIFPIILCLFLPPSYLLFLLSPSKLTITTLLNLNCKRVRTHSPTTLLSEMTSSSSSPPSTTAVVPIANVETNTTNNKQYLCLFSLITAGLLR